MPWPGGDQPPFPESEDRDFQAVQKLPQGAIRAPATLGRSPYRYICEIGYTGEPDNNGSGWFVTPNLIMTAGHVVFDVNQRDDFRRHFDVRLPSGAHQALSPSNSRVFVPLGFFRGTQGTREDDFGFIVLRSPMTDRGELPVHSIDPEGLRAGFTTLSGHHPYPLASGGYPNGPTLWVDRARFTSIDDTRIHYTQAGDAKGKSGGPLWNGLWEAHNPASSQLILGVHIGSQSSPSEDADHVRTTLYKGVAIRMTPAVDACRFEAMAHANAALQGAWPTRERVELLSETRQAVVSPGRGARREVARSLATPPPVESLYVVASPDAEVVHLFGDCPGVQTAERAGEHDVRERPLPADGDVGAAAVAAGRRPCEACAQRAGLSPEELRAIDEGLATAVAPGGPHVRWQTGRGSFGLTLERLVVEDDAGTRVWPMEKVWGARQGSRLATPSLQFKCGRKWLGSWEIVLFEDWDSCDRAYEDVQGLFAVYDKRYVEPDE